MTETRISIANDFSRFPAGRFYTDGPYPGEKFREEVLAPALKASAGPIVVVFDAFGYGSSFLEEAFGGLVREHDYSARQLRERLVLAEVRDRTVSAEVWGYIDDADAKPRKKKHAAAR